MHQPENNIEEFLKNNKISDQRSWCNTVESIQDFLFPNDWDKLVKSKTIYQEQKQSQSARMQSIYDVWWKKIWEMSARIINLTRYWWTPCQDDFWRNRYLKRADRSERPRGKSLCIVLPW